LYSANLVRKDWYLPVLKYAVEYHQISWVLSTYSSHGMISFLDANAARNICLYLPYNAVLKVPTAVLVCLHGILEDDFDMRYSVSENGPRRGDGIILLVKPNLEFWMTTYKRNPLRSFIST